MIVFGKLFGGLLGYVSFGPVGLIAGAILGHFFDTGLTGSMIFMKEGLSESRVAFFQYTFEIMGAIAKADGRVTQAEIQAARNVMAHLNLNEVEKNQAVAYFAVGKMAGYDLDAALIKLKQLCGRDQNLLRLFLEIQLQGAFADGGLHKAERDILNRICNAFNISSNFIDDLTRRSRAEQDFYRHQSSSARVTPKDELKDAYGILGLSAASTPSEIKKAYRRLMSQHHPDKLAAKGLPASMKKIATEKTQQIQKAYEVICKVKGL